MKQNISAVLFFSIREFAWPLNFKTKWEAKKKISHRIKWKHNRIHQFKIPETITFNTKGVEVFLKKWETP